ncbi:MAG: PAS domain S-box protein [Bacteroidales bacterium]|nr:PAS domain S-box protein [Bacteroidales bacterium]
MREVEDLIQQVHEFETKLKSFLNTLYDHEDYFFTSIVNNSPNAVIVVQDDVIIFTNPSTNQLLDLDIHTSLVGRKFFDFIPKKYYEPVKETMALTGQKLPNPQLNIELLRKNASNFYAELTVIPFSYKKKAASLVIIRDNTEFQRQYNDLNLRQLHYKALFDESPVALWDEDLSEVKKLILLSYCPSIDAFKAMIDENPEFVAKCAQFVKVMEVNNAAVEIHNAKNREHLLKDISLTFNKKSWEGFKKVLECIYKGETHFVFETEVMTLDGDIRNIILKGFAPPGYENDYSRVLVTMVDVTYQKRYEKELGALLNAAKAIPQSSDFSEVAEEIFRECKTMIGAKAGYVAILSPDGKENQVVYLDKGDYDCSVDPSIPMPIRGLRAEAYKADDVIYNNDFSASEWVSLLPDGHVGMENVMFIPLKFGKDTVGLIGLANKTGGFSDYDAKLAFGFGEMAAIALKFAQSQGNLVESEEKYKSLMENAPVGMGILKDDYVIYANKEFLNIHEFRSLEEATGKSILEHIHPDDIHLLQHTIEDIGLKRVAYPYALETRIIDVKGKTKYVRIHFTEVFFNGEKNIQFLLQDITKSKLEDKKKKQMVIDTIYTHQKNKTLHDLNKKLHELSLKVDLSKYTEYQNMKYVIEDNLNLDRDWEMLMKYFEETYHGFFKKLSEKHKGLSQNDMKLCAYIKLNMNTKDIARLLNVKPSSIQTARVRLKKKLKLKPENDLISYILKF